jgi:cell division septal protein FtsQ
MSTMGDFRNRPDQDRTLGEAANRWVTWQIVMSLIGLAIFLFFLFFFFMPMWNSFPRP